MDTYQVITDRMIGLLESGTVPWRKEWSGSDLPVNLISKKTYRGINVLLLSMSEYSSPYWLTFNQAKKVGGHVRKGERSTMIVFWKWIDKREDTEDDDKRDGVPYLRYYNVFNVEQCELPDGAVPVDTDSPTVQPIAECERVVSAMPLCPEIAHNGNGRAYYRRGDDSIHMPLRDSFESPEAYHSTLFHELAHSTGHKSRLDRHSLTEYDGFGGQNYSREELIAEMSAAFLNGTTGIGTATIDNSAAYVASWLKALKNDKRMVVTAAAQAQKATDYILGITGPEVLAQVQ